MNDAIKMRQMQEFYDHAEPHEPRHGIPMRCAHCGHRFDQSEAEPLEDVLGFSCPNCGDNDTTEDAPYEPDLPERD